LEGFSPPERVKNPLPMDSSFFGEERGKDPIPPLHVDPLAWRGRRNVRRESVKRKLQF